MGSESPAPSPTAPHHPVLKLPLWGMRIHLPDLKARPGLTSPFRHAHLDSTSNQEPGRKRGTALPSPRMRTSRGGHHFAARGAVRRRRQVSAVPGCPQARPGCVGPVLQPGACRAHPDIGPRSPRDFFPPRASIPRGGRPVGLALWGSASSSLSLAPVLPRPYCRACGGPVREPGVTVGPEGGKAWARLPELFRLFFAFPQDSAS